ncbi:MAG: hypothetical protein IH944_00075 [Armatimonadetes bacterium]|nr:hypothetical protein [Armatimonadota bacterium]
MNSVQIVGTLVIFAGIILFAIKGTKGKNTVKIPGSNIELNLAGSSLVIFLGGVLLIVATIWNPWAKSTSIAEEADTNRPAVVDDSSVGLFVDNLRMGLIDCKDKGQNFADVRSRDGRSLAQIEVGSEITVGGVVELGADVVRKVLIGTRHVGDTPGTVFLFEDPLAEPSREFSLGPDRTFGTGLDYCIVHLLVMELSSAHPGPEIVVVANAPDLYACRVIVLSSNLELLYDYHHPGVVDVMGVLKVKGVATLVCRGVNNHVRKYRDQLDFPDEQLSRMAQPVLFFISSREFSGRTVEGWPYGSDLKLEPASELWYLNFPVSAEEQSTFLSPTVELIEVLGKPAVRAFLSERRYIISPESYKVSPYASFDLWDQFESKEAADDYVNTLQPISIPGLR